MNMTTAQLIANFGPERAAKLLGAKTATPEKPYTLAFTVPGPAVGAPRQTRADRFRRRPCVLAYRDYCDRIRAACQNPPPADMTSLIQVTAFFLPPKSLPKKLRESVTIGTIDRKKRSKPDGDNIGKAVIDAIWKQDSAVGDVLFRRRWGASERTEVLIELEE